MFCLEPVIEVAAFRAALMGEGPHWRSSDQSLFFVDILGQKVIRYKEGKSCSTFQIWDIASFTLFEFVNLFIIF